MGTRPAQGLTLRQYHVKMYFIFKITGVLAHLKTARFFTGDAWPLWRAAYIRIVLVEDNIRSEFVQEMTLPVMINNK